MRSDNDSLSDNLDRSDNHIIFGKDTEGQQLNLPTLQLCIVVHILMCFNRGEKHKSFYILGFSFKKKSCSSLTKLIIIIITSVTYP